MKKQSSQDQVWLGFDIKVNAGPVLRPQKIEFWKEDDFKKAFPQDPFHYFSDALVGLAAVHLSPHFKSPFSGPKMNFPFCHEAWLALEPHHELFERSQPRVLALRHHMKDSAHPLVEYFERNFTETLDSALHPWGIDLGHLCHLIQAIDYLETKMDQTLLYNFNLKLSKPVLEKLHYVHSMLFNLRALVALDYNSHVQDAAHEACKVDSITDYLPKAEYVTNDAMLYWNFKKQKERMKPEVYESLEKTFQTYSHNGHCLVESLPKSFLSSMNIEELEETLYIVQMDWLLGTDAGLLFRIREELYGLFEGYEKVFWPDLAGRPAQNQSHLFVSCQLELDTLYPTNQVA
ncbi:MAG: hypothetical protein ACAH59_00970 [Pseudobdellovibrionaceae bacterium]